MYENFLKKLGLSDEEARIYLHLLNHSKKNISELAHDLDLNRPLLYKTLPYMEEAGLISKILVGKRNYYIAENPKILQSFFNTIQNDFSSFSPKIEQMYSNNFKRPIFKNSHGKIAIRNIFLDIAHSLDVGGIFYRYSSRRDVITTSVPRGEYDKYKKIRDEKRIERMVITNEYLKDIKDDKLEKEVVVIPKEYDLFEDNITKLIYANKVAIIDYNTLECFVIESQIFANFERKLFKLFFELMSKAGY